MSKKYYPHFKQEAINLALNSRQTYQQAAIDLGINLLKSKAIYLSKYYFIYLSV